MTLAQQQGDIMNIKRKIGVDDAENEISVRELVERTMQHLHDTIDSKDVNVNALKLEIKSHFDTALAEYFNWRDDPVQFDKFKFILISQLKVAFRDFCLDYTNNCAAYLSQACMAFREQVEFRIDLRCLPLDHLNSILNDVKVKVIQQYKTSTVADTEELGKRLDETIQLFISDNNKRLAQLYKKFNSILETLIETYEETFETRLPDEDLETATEQKLQSTFEFAKKKVLQQFNKEMDFDVPEMKEIFENRISVVLGERFSEKLNLASSHKEKIFAAASEVVCGAVKKYEQIISDAFATISIDSEMNDLGNSKMNESIISITDRIYEIIPDSKSAKQMLDLARQQMENVVEKLQSERIAQSEIFQQNWDKELHSICETFGERFMPLCRLDVLLNIDELIAERDNLISELLRKINWLDVHNQKELLESFGNAAKQQITAMAQPILEQHSKLLEMNYEHQRQLLTGCLDDLQMKLKEVLATGDAPDVARAKAKTLGAATMANFETLVNDIVPRSHTATKILNENLKREISTAESEFEMDVQNRILMMNAEVSQLVTDSVDDYKQLIYSLSIASNFTKEKIGQIHNNLKSRALRSFQKDVRAMKHVGDVRQQQVKLDAMIDKVFNELLATVDHQRMESNQKLETCIRNSIIHYTQLCHKNLGNAATEVELQKIHEESKEQAIEFWEESFPLLCFGDRLLSERRKFARLVDSEFNNQISPIWHQTNTIVDQIARNAVEKIVTEYETQMNSALAGMDFHSDGHINSKHENFSKEAYKSLSTVNKPKNVSKEVYEDLLSSRLEKTLEYIQNQNDQKKQVVQGKLMNEFHQFKEDVGRMASNWNIFSKKAECFGTYNDRTLKFVNSLRIPAQEKKDLISLSEEKLTTIMDELSVEWDAVQPDANLVQVKINEAVARYKREMDNRTSKKGQVFKHNAMEKYHVRSLEIVQKKFEESVKQTTAAREQFNKAIEEVRKKFEDLNDLKAAEHGEATVGIDLGTTFSCVAIYKAGKIEIIPDREHHSNTVPSYVFYESATKTVVGDSAKDQSVIHPLTTIFDSKRLIGRKFNDPQTRADIEQWPFKVVRDPDSDRNGPKIEVHGSTFHPEEVSSEILKHLKRNAELYLSREVKDVVITVPAYFNDAQKRATKSAAALASINVLEIINEPTSAAIAYSLNYTDGKNKNILVFDLGGGTFDVSVLSTEQCNIKVKAVGGDNHLGGEDFDSNLVDFCIEKFRQTTGLTIPKNISNSAPAALGANKEKAEEETRKIFETLRRLRQKCEKAKINLSKTDKVRVVVDYIYQMQSLDVEVTVEDFNAMNRHLFQKCIKIVSDTVRNSNLTTADIDDVVLGKCIN